MSGEPGGRDVAPAGSSTVPAAGPPVEPAFFRRPAEQVAPELLGLVLVSTVGGAPVAGRIVETEAYVGPHDPASHAAARVGRTRRNDAMYGAPGTSYIYRIYGIHWCFNVVTDAPGYPAAVLIRAIEPVHGVETMQARRGRESAGRELTGGPARLAQALGLTGDLDGHPLDREPLLLCRAAEPCELEVAVGPRIGITRAADWPLRFWVRHSACVSR